jgi:pimeloyl-ACP methyl ester carboxylesterase
VLVAPQPAAAAAAAKAYVLDLHACTQGKSKVPARCGTFSVFENYRAQTGRVIQLRVVLLQATHPAGRAAAWIEGGPGVSAVDDAPDFADGGFEGPIAALRNDGYDLLFVDARGMGRSHPFDCDFVPAGRPQLYLSQIFPDKIVSNCYRKSLATSDPNFYNTSAAVDDLDRVRAAFGYDKLLIDGGSYGTFAALVYLRVHPDRVAAEVLDGVDPPHFTPLLGAPAGAQTALDDLARKCASNHACATHFPQFRQHFDALLARFADGPLHVPVQSPGMKAPVTVALPKEVFIDRMRQALYYPEGASYIPYIVERAYRDDYAPLGRLMDGVTRNFSGGLNMGANLSYTCADMIPFITDARLEAEAATSFTGDLRVKAQRRACSIFKVRPMPPAFNDIVRASVPVLLVTGTDDPATPPRFAAEELPYLSRAKEIVVRGGGHGNGGPCVDRLVTAFVKARSAAGLDVGGCKASFETPPFATSMSGFPDP